MSGVQGLTDKLFYYLVALLFVAATLVSSLAFVKPVFADGEIVIDDCEELQLIGHDELYPLDGDYILEADVDCSMTNPEDPDWDDGGTWQDGEGFMPIGTVCDEGCVTSPFLGTLDGQGNSVTGLFIERDYNRQGLFAQVGEWGDGAPLEAGLVQNLGVDDAFVDCVDQYTSGILVGVLFGTAINTWSSGEIHCDYETGGLVGGHLGWDTVNSSHSSATVYGEHVMGGLVGGNYNQGQILNSYATGDVYGSSDVGGLAGYSYEGTITDSHATGTLYVRNSGSTGTFYQFGGLVGQTDGGSITGSYATGGVQIETHTNETDYMEYIGGLVGYVEDETTITDSYAEGSIELVTTDGVDVYSVGGLAGYAYDATIDDSRADVAITIGSDDQVYSIGGLVGYADSTSIQSTTAEGNVAVNVGGYTGSIGGFIGYGYYLEVSDGSKSTGSLDVTSSGEADDTGGFIGYADSLEVDGAHATGDIKITAEGAADVDSIGGFIGYTEDEISIESSYATGDVDIVLSDPSDMYVYQIGGFIGVLCDDDPECSISKSYSTGDVSIITEDADGDSWVEVYEVGGFIGEVYYLSDDDDYITESFTESDVTIELEEAVDGYVEVVGGFIGDIEEVDEDTVLSNNYSRSNITITAPGDVYAWGVGGFIGEADSDGEGVVLRNSYYAGKIDISVGDYIENVAGFIGEDDGYDTQNNFAASTIVLDGDVYEEYVAAFVAYNDGGDNDDYSNNYAFESTGNWNYCYGEDSSLSSGCSIVAGAHVFKSVSNQPLSQWDFDGIWTLDTNGVLNGGFPYFQWYEPSPEGADLNGDGIPDSEQPHVQSLTSPLTGKTVVLELSDGCSVNSLSTSAEASLAQQDAGYKYNEGLVNFAADCEDATSIVKIYHYGVTAADIVVRKHNPNTNAFFAIDGATVEQVTLNGQIVAVASYSITDGGVLDMDNTVNGTIVDPAGLATLATGAPNTGLGAN